MPIYQFSLLIQAAGTALLLVLFLLVYRRIRLPALREWIASWALLLGGLTVLWASPALGAGRGILYANHAALLAHALFLLRGIGKLREPRGGRATDLLWLAPILGIAWLTSSNGPKYSAFVALLLAAAYVTAAVAFAVTPGSTMGRLLLSISFLLWGVEQAVIGAGLLRFQDTSGMPGTLQHAGF